MSTLYNEFSILYDRFVNWQSRLSYEMPFIERQLETIEKAPGDTHILDAACGTGMHVVELSQRGYHAAGADSSKPMILKAIENAVTYEVKANFKTAGFGELCKAFLPDQSDFRFDAIFCLGNSIPHILSAAELKAALLDFHACLAQDGFVLIQNRNFDAVVASQQRWMEPQYHHSIDGEWIFIRFYDFKADGKIDFNILTLHRGESPEWRQSVQTIPLYPWQSETLLDELSAAGFSKLTCYGDMTGSDFDPQTSGNLVIRAEVR